MSRFLVFLLLVVSIQVCGAQEGVSVWNSCTGSTVEIFLDSKADPVKLQLVVAGREPRDYRVSKVSENWFEYQAARTTMRASFLSANEIEVSGGGNNYRWTRRNAKLAFPIPNGEKCEKTYWRTDGSEKKYLLLLSPDSCSVMSAIPSQGKKRYRAYQAKWVEYPKTLLVKTEPPRTFRFLNPMLFKDGSTHWYQSDEKK